MKRYLCFAGYSYYSEGGFLDCCGSASTKIKAVEICLKKEQDWWHVVDTKTGKIVAGVSGDYCGQLNDATLLSFL